MFQRILSYYSHLLCSSSATFYLFSLLHDLLVIINLRELFSFFWFCFRVLAKLNISSKHKSPLCIIIYICIIFSTFPTAFSFSIFFSIIFLSFYSLLGPGSQGYFLLIQKAISRYKHFLVVVNANFYEMQKFHIYIN